MPAERGGLRYGRYDRRLSLLGAGSPEPDVQSRSQSAGGAFASQLPPPRHIQDGDVVGRIPGRIAHRAARQRAAEANAAAGDGDACRVLQVRLAHETGHLDELAFVPVDVVERVFLSAQPKP